MNKQIKDEGLHLAYILGKSEGIKQGRADAIDEFVKALLTEYCNYCNQIACDGGRIGSIQECASVSMLVEVMKDLADQLKE